MMINVTRLTIPDLWFQIVFKLLSLGGRSIGIKFVTPFINGLALTPGSGSLFPAIPEGIDLSNPVDEKAFFGDAERRGYLNYFLTDKKEPGEVFTYGERLTSLMLSNDATLWLRHPDFAQIIDQGLDTTICRLKGDHYLLNQIELAISQRKKYSTLWITTPDDCLLTHPPKLQFIDITISPYVLNFSAYFKSIDVLKELPRDLAALQILKNTMADRLGADSGSLTVNLCNPFLSVSSDELQQYRKIQAYE